MRKTIIILILLLIAAPVSHAFIYQIEVLDKDAIRKMSDDKLLDTYIDVIVEYDAVKTFHQTSGFKPADYEKYKNLVRYRIILLKEIRDRGLDVPDASFLSSPKEEIKAE